LGPPASGDTAVRLRWSLNIIQPPGAKSRFKVPAALVKNNTSGPSEAINRTWAATCRALCPS
jgi:hypothetical protein